MARLRGSGAAQPKPSSWRVLLIGGGVLLVVSFGLGQYWQPEIRDLMGVTEYNIALVVLSPFVAVFFFALFLLIGRGIRRVYHWVADLLSRRFGGGRRARPAGSSSTTLTYLVVSGVLLDGLVSAMDEAFSVRNTITQEGVVQPTTGLRSGGPGSMVPWDSLGREGRTFAGDGADGERHRDGRPPPARSRSAPTPAWTRPTTRSNGRPWPSTTSSGRAASSARTCSS